MNVGLIDVIKCSYSGIFLENIFIISYATSIFLKLTSWVGCFLNLIIIFVVLESVHKFPISFQHVNCWVGDWFDVNSVLGPFHYLYGFEFDFCCIVWMVSHFFIFTASLLDLMSKKCDPPLSSSLHWFLWGHWATEHASQSSITLNIILWGGWFLPPGLHYTFFSFCLLLPDRDGADCVSLTTSAAPIPQGAPLTMTRLSAGEDSTKTGNTKQSKRWES